MLSIKRFISVFGKEYGSQLHAELKARNAKDLDCFIVLYGDKEGTRSFKELCLKRSGTLDAFIKRYGEEKGTQKYNEKVEKSRFTLENQIRIYGIEEGTKRFNAKRERDKIKGTLQYYIEKYGEIEGKHRYLEKNKKISVGTESLKRNGKTSEEIKDIQSTHRKNSAITIDNMIKRYGEIEGTIRYNSYVEIKKKQSLRTLTGWLLLGYSEKEANEKLKEYQATFTKKNYIKKYGEIEGKEKFETEKRNKAIQLLKYRYTGNGVSKLETSFFQKLSKITELDLERGLQCKIKCKNINFYCDYYHSSNKKIIEIFGDYWHMNPALHKSTELNERIQKTSAEIWKIDENRIAELRTAGYETLIIWESDIKRNISEQLLIAKQFLES